LGIDKYKVAFNKGRYIHVHQEHSKLLAIKAIAIDLFGL